MRAYISVSLLLERGDELLFHLRQNTGFMDGHWGLVAGHVEAGESALQAMVREAREEAGIVIAPKDLEVVHTVHSKRGREYIALYVRCNRWEGEIINCEPERCGGLAFFSQGAFPTPMIPFVKSTLELINEGKIYSEIGF